MSLGLENIGAIFQRLMDKVFAKQIGKNVEVYVEEILIKSKRKEDLAETFSILAQVTLKINAVKCAFGIKECIKTHQEKVGTIINMKPTRTMKHWEDSYHNVPINVNNSLSY